MSGHHRPEDLIAIRKGLDFTQTAMADLLGMSLRAYQALEAGESTVRPIHILAAERAAMMNAVLKGSPMLAPESVRADALDLVTLIRGL
jgi:DNA-binding XRE family transcriptional regulator